MDVGKSTPCEQYPGFYEIPGFSRYGVNHFGAVVNKVNSLLTDPVSSAAGYVYYHLVPDARESRMRIGRHRVMALAFCPTDKEISPLLYVNHKNGIRGNDFIGNLEWVTPQENVEHAGMMGLTPKCLPVSVRDVDTAEIVIYSSITSAARALGMSKDAILYRLRFSRDRVFPERKQYHLGVEDDDWNSPEDIDIAILQNRRTVAVDVRNIVTGAYFSFCSMTAAAQTLGIPFSTIAAWAKRKGQPVLPGNIQIRITARKEPWRAVGDIYIERANASNTRPVEIVSLSGERRIFGSAAECADALGIKPTALDYRLKTSGKVVFGGYRYGYYPLSVSIQTSPTSQ